MLEIYLSDELKTALDLGKPVVALESTVITHGLPYPQNQELALDMETVVRDNGAVPATIAVMDGQLKAGLEPTDLEKLAQAQEVIKVSTRNIGAAISKKQTGGTTVAATSLIAEMAGIRVFATGGIGGVHRNSNWDVSADLLQLARTEVVVVCAGAKSILDLPATIEVLESYSIPVVGYQTDEFPSFFSVSSGLPVSARVDDAAEAAALAKAHWSTGTGSGILLVNPPPEETSVPRQEIDSVIDAALAEADGQHISGPAITPFLLLAKVSELSGGKSLKANLALLKNNAMVAARIACSLAA